MPDESCRTCGKPLYDYLKCLICRSIFQEICMNCGRKTIPRYHMCKLEKENCLLI